MSRRVTVLVEGYDDRSFWSGLLQQAFGYRRSDEIPEALSRTLLDEDRRWLRKVGGGRFKYAASDGTTLVEVVPYQGRRPGEDALRALFDERLEGRQINPVAGLIVVRDDDQLVGAAPANHASSVRQWLDANAAVEEVHDCGAGLFKTEDGAFVLSVTWRSDDADMDELPAKQTLERLAFSALRDVYPQRTDAVRAWLAGRPDLADADAPDHKASTGVYWGGWAAGSGWQRFFEALWEDPPVRDALVRRLDESGAWQHLATLLGAASTAPSVPSPTQ